MHLITQVTFEEPYWRNRAYSDDLNQLSRILTETDPISGRITVTVYTDDGAGNGLPILSFPLN